jgi:predicted kinase
VSITQNINRSWFCFVEFQGQVSRDLAPVKQIKYKKKDSLKNSEQSRILCTGKSTFSKALEQAMPYKFARINQDDLGSRRHCEERARLALSEGKCPVIDRCNFDADQREKFIKIAHELEVPVDCIVFEMETLVTVDECIKRCRERRGHPTIQPGEAKGVVIGMAKQMKTPKLIGNKEGIRIVDYITSKHKFNDFLTDYMNKI